MSDREIGDALADYITELVGRLGLPTRLSQVGVPEDGIPALVEGAMGDGTTLLNPREMSRGGLRGAVPRGSLSVGHLLERRPWRCASAASAAASSRASVFISTGFFTEWIQATCSGISGSRVAISAVASTSGFGTGTEYQPSASATSDIVSVPLPARLYGPGLAEPAHSGRERARHVVLVHELEADARVRDHRLQHGQRAEQARHGVGHGLLEAVVGDLLEHRARLGPGDDAGPERVRDRARVAQQHLAEHALDLGLLVRVRGAPASRAAGCPR